jgi:ATP-dependent RNA helicase DeaD
LGLAATGTGKTAAFAIPLLENTNPQRRVVQTLVLCPTRELALQVTEQINLLGKYMGVRALAVYGGSSYGDQISGLKRGVTIVVGTPGRVVDHLDRGTLKINDIDRIILDEADEMISMGFKDDLEKILESVPEGSANIWLFSATMSSEVRKVADRYLHHPQQVQVNKKEMLPETVEQIYYVTQESNKPEVLCKLMDAADDFYGIVFCQTKNLVIELTQYLKGRNYRADCLHGDMDQNARERTVKGFRERKISVLICTDVASRGLDVKEISHVINYSIPRELDSYVHRIGRTARSGRSGFAMSLVTASHRGLIPRIEKMTKRRMIEGKIPSRREIGIKKVSKVLANFKNQPAYSRAIELMGDSWKEEISKMSPDEIAGRFLAMMYPEIFTTRDEAEVAKPNRGAPAFVVKPNEIRGEKKPESDHRKKKKEKKFKISSHLSYH